LFERVLLFLLFAFLSAVLWLLEELDDVLLALDVESLFDDAVELREDVVLLSLALDSFASDEVSVPVSLESSSPSEGLSSGCAAPMTFAPAVFRTLPCLEPAALVPSFSRSAVR
jgi:hypothetical protein